VIEINATADAIKLESNDITENGTTILIPKEFNQSSQDVGKAFFVDGDFRGIIDTVNTNSDGNTEVSLKDAQSIDEAYEHISIEMGTGVVQKSLRDMSSNIKGKYDYFNPGNPIRTSIYTKPSLTRDGIGSDDLYLRIDIPQGYRFPVLESVIRDTSGYI
jgi:hypothetical protein